MQLRDARTILVLTAAFCRPATIAAQSVTLVGTGDPDIDVTAVQAAVDQNRRVVLAGHFSFDRVPTTPAGATYSRMVTVSRGIVISGATDQNGGMPTIDGGNWPFFIDAAGSPVAIEGLRFVRPRGGAIWIYAVRGLAIANCRIEGVEATAEFGMQAGQTSALANGVFVGGNPRPPSVSQPGQPENFSGALAIRNNDIDMAGAANTLALGIVLFAAGSSPDQEVDIDVSGNSIRNVTEPAINFRIIGGRANAERNTISTGGVAGGTPDAIRVVGAGSYLIAQNSIDCGWGGGVASAISVFGQSANLPQATAIVVNNDVTMSAPDGTVFADNSAGIQIRGFAQGNEVLNNRIRGRARAALAVSGQNGGSPANTAFVSNNLDGFQASLADLFIDAGATNTAVLGRQMRVEDHGSSTVVVPLQ
jgi:hypothetical protein